MKTDIKNHFIQTMYDIMDIHGVDEYNMFDLGSDIVAFEFVANGQTYYVQSPNVLLK